jgi:hypothetical protein
MMRKLRVPVKAAGVAAFATLCALRHILGAQPKPAAARGALVSEGSESAPPPCALVRFLQLYRRAVFSEEVAMTRSRLVAVACLTALAWAGPAAADVSAYEDGRFTLGVYGSVGMAFMSGGSPGLPEGPRCAGGAGVTFGWRFSKAASLSLGAGLIGKGARTTSDNWTRVRIQYAEVPLGVRVAVRRLRIGFALAIDIAFAAQTTDSHNDMGDSATEDWGGDEWDGFRRVNFGPLLSIGYVFPTGSAAIVPSISAIFDLLENEGSGASHYGENMNVMFNLGVEFGLGG